MQSVLGRYMPEASKGHIVYYKPDGEVYKNRKLRDLSDTDALEWDEAVGSSL